jgi:hypothetical protein
MSLEHGAETVEGWEHVGGGKKDSGHCLFLLANTRIGNQFKGLGVTLGRIV